MDIFFAQRSLPDFLIVTLILGGGAAMLAGRAVALGWRPVWTSLLWMIPLTAAVRFIHFVLFRAPLFSADLYAVDLAVLLLAAALGHRRTRTGQMVGRYPWIIRSNGPLSWRRTSGGDEKSDAFSA